MAAQPDKVVRVFNDLWGRSGNWRTLWQELSDFILPRKSDIEATKSPGEKRFNTLRHYESTAVKANDLLATAINGNLTNMSMRWFLLKAQEEELNQAQAMGVWLEEVGRRIFLALRQANFTSEAPEVYLDLGAFGTGAFLVTQRAPSLLKSFTGIRFESFPISSYVVAENEEGRVNVMYRRIKLSARAMANRWGEDKISFRTRAKLEKNEYERITIIHGIYPREGVSEDSATIETPATKMPYASVYVEEEEKHLLQESGFHEFPCQIPRWTKASGEDYGRGPGEVALADIKSLNELRKQKLRSVALQTNPPLAARHRGVLGRVRFGPLAVNSVKQQGDLQALDIGGNINAATFQEGEWKIAIQQAFFTDQLQFPAKEGTPISATEAQIRFELMQRVLGPTLGRLQDEFLSPLIDRVFRILLRADQLPPPPAELLAAVQEGKAGIDVEYQGPIAVAQRASGADVFARTMNDILPIAEANPEVLDVFNFDNAARFVGTERGLPRDLMRGPEEIEEIREARRQAQEEQAQMEELESTAKVIGKVAPVLESVGEAAGAGG